MSIPRDDDIIGIYELLDAIEAVIKAADPAKRETLAQTIDAYAEDFPDDEDGEYELSVKLRAMVID